MVALVFLVFITRFEVVHDILQVTACDNHLLYVAFRLVLLVAFDGVEGRRADDVERRYAEYQSFCHAVHIAPACYAVELFLVEIDRGAVAHCGNIFHRVFHVHLNVVAIERLLCYTSSVEMVVCHVALRVGEELCIV